ncbi:hypothetical protein BO71DRAFT_122786 [Aspergillus ellipticus CBS 707.79]|uniref:Uncharacterized protein n=1 Tax=Aspergillus ellipticus CBS 707.79 TaxID=1448320 RepID=A0A319CUN9_9EURO|nr:hypothetical protein BO71DRAFT_122786 [Aspergillus ellipticus CBS 707.79]
MSSRLSGSGTSAPCVVSIELGLAISALAIPPLFFCDRQSEQTCKTSEYVVVRKRLSGCSSDQAFLMVGGWKRDYPDPPPSLPSMGKLITAGPTTFHQVGFDKRNAYMW